MTKTNGLLELLNCEFERTGVTAAILGRIV